MTCGKGESPPWLDNGVSVILLSVQVSDSSKLTKGLLPLAYAGSVILLSVQDSALSKLTKEWFPFASWFVDQPRSRAHDSGSFRFSMIMCVSWFMLWPLSAIMQSLANDHEITIFYECIGLTLTESCRRISQFLVNMCQWKEWYSSTISKNWPSGRSVGCDHLVQPYNV